MRQMTTLERWKRFRILRNRFLKFAFLTGIIGFIGIVISVKEPKLDKLPWGVKVGLSVYVIIIGVSIAIAIVYHYRMRKIVKSI